jgi:transmembrane sensor
MLNNSVIYMDSQRFDYLFNKFIDKSLSPTELAELIEVATAGDDEHHFNNLFDLKWRQSISQSRDAISSDAPDRIYNNIIGLPSSNDRIRKLWLRIAAAASIVFCLGIGSYYYNHQKRDRQLVQNKPIENDVAAGSNKAYLTLGNGRRISLTDAKNGTIASQAGKTIQKTADGLIAYDISNSIHKTTEIIFNTIETPRGGQYQVVLPDGSKVWLNSASSLKYPAAFTGTNRQVELNGEAYFEVAKDKAHPFKVKTNKETVEVLGTHFNINSYSDEPTIKTTLLEGSVKITTANQQQIIKPGEQAVLGSSLKIQQADEEEVLAWKNGLFMFNDEPLESIMRKVSRWYDVDIQYGDIDKTQSFGGGVSRFDNISKVLQKLEITRMVHFKIQGKTIYVTK